MSDSPAAGRIGDCSIETDGAVPTGNVAPLLHEIRHALERWLDEGEEHAIDLRGIPMAPGEEEQILATLGEGEVSVALALLGPSQVIETRFPGVWLITHCNTEEQIIGRYVEICELPAILKSQTEDARAGLQALDELLSHATEASA